MHAQVGSHNYSYSENTSKLAVLYYVAISVFTYGADEVITTLSIPPSLLKVIID